MTSTTGSARIPGLGMLRQAGSLFALGLDVIRLLFRRPFQLRAFIHQGWFIAYVTILRTALVAVRFGAVVGCAVLRRRRECTGDGAAGCPVGDGVVGCRRGWFRDLCRYRCAYDPRRDRCDGGTRRLRGAAARGATSARVDVGGDAVERH